MTLLNINTKTICVYKTILFLTVIILTLQVFLISSAFCQNIVVLTDNCIEYPIGLSLELFEDKGRNLTIDDMIKPENTLRFKPSEEIYPNFGLNSSAIWSRFTVKNESNKDIWLLEFSMAKVGEIELYMPDYLNGYHVKKTGYMQPINMRDVPHRYFVFNMPISKGETKTFYLRIVSQDAINLPIYIETEHALDEKDYQRQYLLGIYYGVLTVMLFYNLFIYLSLRDISYLYYVLYFGSFLMVQSYIDGTLYGYGWTELTGLGIKGECFFTGLTMIFGIIFSKSFLQTAVYAKNIDKVIRILLFFSCIYTLLTFLIQPTIMFTILSVLGLIVIITTLYAAAICYYRGYRPARFYLLATILFLSGISLKLLANLSIVPMNFLATHGMHIGSGLDVTMLSIALADRISILRGEKEKAEIETKMLNIQLEQKVLERTAELKESRDQLVQSEKMASLGLLVAGVAHEINTPIGIGITATSHFQDITEKIINLFENKIMKRSDLDRYFKDAKETSFLIFKNLKRIGDLIISFKMISADQAYQEIRKFNLSLYIKDIIISLSPKLKTTKHVIEVQCPENIEIKSNPGALSQIITNLIMNSLIHAFDEEDKGHIIILCEKINDIILLKYSDNGKGISEKHLHKIFDPFFTTKRGSGGTGLGLNIVFNLVNQNLNGTIRCESIIGKGATFILELPVDLNNKASA
ncbi:MAG: sensor histidine kinase [Nitrospirae bacterium]|nr:sensor histidine kinase [Nitrospirota bacterium]MBF0541419.1 sensor histidine kinase [Nitrospirota bacterium]